MKRLTYKELEQERNDYIIGIIILFAFFSVCFTFICIIFNNSIEMYKLQLNKTEGKNYSCDFVGPIKSQDTRTCEVKF